MPSGESKPVSKRRLPVSKRRLPVFTRRIFATAVVVGLIAAAFYVIGGNRNPAVFAQNASAKLRVFFIGNSLTDTIGYVQFEKLAIAGKQSIIWGRHTGPGATLDGLYKPNDKGELYGIAQEPFGKSPEALAKHTWDVVTLQPFDRPLDTIEANQLGDIANVNAFLLMLNEGPNKDTQVYIHAHWPRRFAWDKTVETAPPFDYQAKWEKTYGGGWSDFETRDFYEKLLAAVNKENPLNKPVLILPAGEVIYEIDKAAKAGQIPGVHSANDMYSDHIHFSEKGRYVTAITFYATIFKKSPEGLSASGYGLNDPAFEKAVQELVWRVVSTHPNAGIAK